MGCGCQHKWSAFDEDAQTVLELAGVAIARHPSELVRLLKSYGVRVTDEQDEEEITELLVDAIGQRSSAFNNDLAMLLIEKFIPVEYENFDLPVIGKGDSKGAGIQVGTDPVGMVAGAIGSIFNFANSKSQKKIAQEQAKAATFSGIMNYKAEKAKNKKSGNQGTIIAIVGGGFLVIVLLLFVMYKGNGA